MADDRIRATGVVVRARELVKHQGADQGETAWWEDALSWRFGKEKWQIELEIHLPGHAPYRVMDTWKMPTRTVSLKNAIRNRQPLRPGVQLPVLVDARNAMKVEIDWTLFRESGGVDQVTASDEPSVRESLRGFVADVRSGPQAPPDPRPTPASHQPVDGVDFDMFARAVAGLHRKMSDADREAHYRAIGFPPGRGDAILNVWYARVQSDAPLLAWYTYEVNRLR